MIRDFSKDDLEAAESVQDTELTLGGGTLLVLGCGLLVLCTICFSIGYFVGHRSVPESAAASSPSSGSRLIPVPTGSGSKPGAAGQPPAKPQAIAMPDASADSSLSPRPIDAQSGVAAGNPNASPTQGKPALDPLVHPALAGQTSGAQPASVLQVQPAMTQVQGWMVQIAAVSHPEDAEVLVNALRKRGYTVTARREVGDNLIHVQTGSFANRNDANSMRQKLLNDGYNAIVE
jgi:DedD protein